MAFEKTRPRLRILIVDDHPMMREGVEGAIQRQSDMMVVGEASDGAEAIKCYFALRPDVVLMDLQMPGMGGVEAITAICKENPGAKIIVLTTYSGDMRALRALKAGAVGYLLKGAVRKELISTIRAVYDGARFLPPEIASDIAAHAIEEQLTSREIEVLRCLAGGNANKEIAWRLSISEDTVKSHLKSIFTKLNTSDRTGAVTVASRRGIIDL